VRWISAFLVLVAASLGLARGAGACSMTVVALDFGPYDARSAAPLDSTTSVRVSCFTGTPYLIRIDAGGNSGGSFLPRKMRRTGGAYKLSYNLYRDSARTEIWGDGTGKTYVVNGTALRFQQTRTVYGRIPGSQNVPPGAYTDTVTVTLEW
jgi:spore coat protein U-like protein